VTDPNLFLVFSNPVTGREVAFNEWYDAVHVPEVLAVPGVVAARRYEVAPMETPELEGVPSPEPPAHGYLAVYELDRDANAVMADFVERIMSGALDLSEDLDLGRVAMSVWQPIGDRRVATDG
jgi:hypothetical protein